MTPDTVVMADDLGIGARIRVALELSPTVLAITSVDDGRFVEIDDAFTTPRASSRRSPSTRTPSPIRGGRRGRARGAQDPPRVEIDGDARARMVRSPTAAAVSIVMPVYDAAGTLATALDSVRAQTDPAWELVAVDDGSTDGSAAILAAAARRDRRIRVVAAPHRGVVAALTLGLDAARGRFIARMDADDVCLPDRLAKQRRRLEERHDLGLVACRVHFGGDPARAGGYARYVEWTNRLLTHDDIAGARFVESPLAHPSVMFRREVLERWGGYAEGDFPEDYELWLRWLDAGVRMEKLAEPLLVWNDGPARLSRSDPRYADAAFARVKARYLARWLARHNAHHPRVVLWGAGRVTRRRARDLVARGIEITAYVDIDPRKIGRRLHGTPVLAPGDLPAPGTAFVVSYVGSAGARDEIDERLRRGGFEAGRDYVLAG